MTRQRDKIKNNIVIHIPLHMVLAVTEIFAKTLNNLCDDQKTSAQKK